MKKGSFAGNWAVAVINLRKGVATADRRWSTQLGAASDGRWQEQPGLRCACAVSALCLRCACTPRDDAGDVKLAGIVMC